MTVYYAIAERLLLMEEASDIIGLVNCAVLLSGEDLNCLSRIGFGFTALYSP